MGKAKISQRKIDQMITLRKTGHSLPEIYKIVGCGYGTVYRYVRNVKVKGEFKDILRFKQGRSKARSEKLWDVAKIQAVNLLESFDVRSKLFLLAGLYWGEGTKKELCIMNGDPRLLKVFVSCLKELGVEDSEMVFSLRLFGSSSKNKSLKYWSEGLGISSKIIRVGEVIPGSDSNRLPYGMCRIRVIKGGKYFKLIMSMIEYIGIHV